MELNVGDQFVITIDRLLDGNSPVSKSIDGGTPFVAPPSDGPVLDGGGP